MEFKGFSKELIGFLRGLSLNNSKEWFSSRRDEYERLFKGEASSFCIAMGNELKKLSPGIKAIPKVNQSLFKIHRDVRFSPDKRPFKTHMGIWFWEGDKKRMECSGFYFHLEPDFVLLGAGIHIFPKDIIPPFRQSVIDKLQGKKLSDAIDEVKSKGDYTIEGEHYKRIPAGFDNAHKNSSYLKYNGLTVGKYIKPLSGVIFTPDIIDVAFKAFNDFKPLHDWLFDLTKRV
jgi:uncharacterized protein (TIGR02453 family)